MKSTYDIVREQRILEKVRSRYETDANSLKSKGFEELNVYSESGPALSVFLMWIMLFYEVSNVSRRLQIRSFILLMRNRRQLCYATVFRLGIRFYTEFDDAILVITSSFETKSTPPEGCRVGDCLLYRFSATGDLNDAWDQHQASIRELQSAGFKPLAGLRFENFLKLERLNDAFMAASLQQVSS